MEILKSELDLSLDNFQNQKLYSTPESIAQIILNIILMRPGSLPGLPHIGIDIREYLYKHVDTFNTEELKAKLMSQCTELLPGFVTGDIDLYFVDDHKGQPLLIIAIGVAVNSSLLNIGITKNETGDLTYLYEFEKQLTTN